MINKHIKYFPKVREDIGDMKCKKKSERNPNGNQGKAKHKTLKEKSFLLTSVYGGNS